MSVHSIHDTIAFRLPFDASGQLDTAFACNGKAWLDFPGSLWSMANDVVVDQQGRLVVAAKVAGEHGCQYGLTRLQADGSLDQSFAAGGSLVGQFEPGCESTAGKIQLLADGRILLSGLMYENPQCTLPALALFDQHGNLDRSFCDQGIKVVRLPGNLSQGVRDPWLPPGVPGAEACDVQVQADGRILLLANHQYEFSDHVGIVIRLTAQGDLDPSFNGRGFVMVRHLLLNTWLSSLLVQKDGAIVVAGSIDTPQQGLLARFDSDGQLDGRFGEHGFLGFSIDGRSAQVSQVIEQANGNLLCFGSSRDPMHCLSLTVRRDGRADSRSNAGLPRLTIIGHSPSQWTAATASADGRVYSVGATVGGVEADFILARHLPDGRPDLEFAEGNGWVRTRLGRSLDTATAIALQDSQRVVVAGYSLDGHYRAVLVRYRA
ncbi:MULTISPECIES: hypothetical protein [Pseudomonas]|uniref:hypothetical protein n=1 Tax=Pseudomonas TaxID=286 RepID=UPI000D002845|nr:MULTISPECIES: hypothetical protein [Pseudomonas]PRA56889.1 hypothetical protein CQZ98_08525 [Pseudomonas sp. MYb115]QXN47634.1 hypothetical protein KW062_15050 [Pseudomonas fluorescens]WSO21936.1 hypothetical protein VUJ50_15140 [Pseudomonas fluorescens]